MRLLHRFRLPALNQRPLCGRQQNGVAARGVDNGVYLARFDR